MVDKNTHSVQDLCKADAFDYFFYGDNSELDAIPEGEKVRCVNFKRVCKV